ncbi:MAG: hypothetical protein ABR500_06690 [Dermatophilaceae bacterium]|nr:hypothetical protein [Intrasporangiaceae bacterium]
MQTLTRPGQWIAVLALLIAAGSSVAALNWYGTWASFARLDVQSGQGVVSGATVEAVVNYQQWMLSAVICLVVFAAASASTWLPRASISTPRGLPGKKADVSAE